MALTSNVSGRMYALTVLTPIAPGREEGLRRYLEGLHEERPLARVPGTHFGRWVIVPHFGVHPGPREPDASGGSYLLFSATFDGELDDYLDALCTDLADAAAQIWGACIGSPDPPGGAALEAYLRRNQIDTGLFFSAYPDASVERVRECLETRRRTIAFALRAQGMEPAALRSAFLEEFGRP
jgi:hypothetical protein